MLGAWRLGERRVNASMRNSATSATSSPSDSLPARKGFPARFSRSRVQRPRSSGFRHHRYANLPLQLVATAIGNPLMWVNMSSSYAAAHGRTRDTTRAESSQMSFSRRRNAASRRKFEGEFSSFFFIYCYSEIQNTKNGHAHCSAFTVSNTNCTKPPSLGTRVQFAPAKVTKHQPKMEDHGNKLSKKNLPCVFVAYLRPHASRSTMAENWYKTPPEGAHSTIISSKLAEDGNEMSCFI